MSNEPSLLPPGFGALEPFVALWSVAGTANRAQLRSERTAAERLAFYEAAKDMAAAALAFLDQKPLRDLDAAEQRLMNLMLSLAHVALSVEAQGPDEARHAEARRHMKITRASADMPPAA